MCTNSDAYTGTGTNTHTQVDAHTQTHIHTHQTRKINALALTHAHAHIYTHTRVRAHTHTLIHTRVCAHTHTRTHRYTHTHTSAAWWLACARACPLPALLSPLRRHGVPREPACVCLLHSSLYFLICGPACVREGLLHPRSKCVHVSGYMQRMYEHRQWKECTLQTRSPARQFGQPPTGLGFQWHAPQTKNTPCFSVRARKEHPSQIIIICYR